MRYAVASREFAAFILGPLLADLLVALALFWMNLQAVRMGVPPKTQAWIGGLFAVGYTVSAHLAGRWTTPRNATRIIVSALLSVAVLGTLACFASRFWVFLPLALCVGASAGHYFVPFQVKMRHVQPFATLAWTVAFYNVSWGSGWALGPFIGGFLRGATALWLAATVWLVTAFHVTLVVITRGGDIREPEPFHPSAVFASTPVLRRIGWLSMCVAGAGAMGLVWTLWPALGNIRGFTDRQIAIGVTAFSMQIPLASLFWAALRRRLIRPTFLLAVTALHGLLYLVVPCTASWPLLLVAFVLLGFTYTGVVFHAVYYSNADPTDAARSVGINESVIGFGNIVGPLLMGSLAWTNAGSLRPYAAGALIMVAVAGVGTRLWRRAAVTAEVSAREAEAVPVRMESDLMGV